jgi:hypothetical protein
MSMTFDQNSMPAAQTTRMVIDRVYRKLRNGQPWHLSGVDVFAVRDGKWPRSSLT